MSKVNERRPYESRVKTQSDIKQVEEILRKSERKEKLTPQEVETFNKLAPELKGQVEIVGTKSQIQTISKAADLAGTGAFSSGTGGGQSQVPPPIPEVPRLSGSAGNDATRNYERSIDQEVKREIQGYESLLKQQQEAFTRQLSEQQNFLSSQIGTIQSQSQEQLQSYQSMLDQLTQKQATELEAIRNQYSQENALSEQTLAKLQADIERLQPINKPPIINVDTRPALVGRSKAVRASQSRQQLGMIGTRRATPKAAEGGKTIGRLGLAIAS